MTPTITASKVLNREILQQTIRLFDDPVAFLKRILTQIYSRKHLKNAVQSFAIFFSKNFSPKSLYEMPVKITRNNKARV